MSKKPFYLLLLGIFITIIAFVGFWINEYNKINNLNSNIHYNIEVILKSVDENTNFWNNVQYGIRSAANEANVIYNITAPVSEADIDGQIELMQDAIKKKPDAIILSACDYERLSYVCELAKGEGIPIVMVDSDVDYDKKSSYIGTNNYELGELLSDLVNENIKDNEQIAVISYVKGTYTSDERLRGFIENLDNYKIRLNSINYCNGDEILAEQLVEQIIQSTPNVKCFVGLNENSSRGVANAIYNLGLADEIDVFTADISEKQIQYLENGTIDASVVQNPNLMGYIAMRETIELLNGSDIEKEYYTQCKVVTKKDLSKPELQQLIIPFE